MPILIGILIAAGIIAVALVGPVICASKIGARKHRMGWPWALVFGLGGVIIVLCLDERPAPQGRTLGAMPRPRSAARLLSPPGDRWIYRCLNPRCATFRLPTELTNCDVCGVDTIPNFVQGATPVATLPGNLARSTPKASRESATRRGGCIQCDCENFANPKQPFCGYCGHASSEHLSNCRTCGESLAVTNRFCPACGLRVAAREPAAT